MKHTTLKMLALAMGATSLCNAGTAAPVTTDAPVAESFSFCKWLPSKFAWFDAERDNAVNPYIQSFDVTFRAQYQWGSVDPNGDHNNGRSSNNEFRRIRLGAKATVFEDYKVEMVWNLGGVASTFNSAGDRTDTSSSLESLSVATTIADTVNVHLGKTKPAYIGEKRTSSAKIKTIERSAIVNQLVAGTNLWGLTLKDPNKKSTLSWETSIYAQGVHDDIWTEPAFNSDTSAMFAGSLSYKTSDNSKLYLDYMHSFANDEDIAAAKADGVSYKSIGARDVLALSYEYKKDQWYFMGELVGGFNVLGADEGAENVFGFVLIPTYRISDHFEGVFRYQLSSGSNAVELYSRYTGKNSDYSSTCDLMQALYFGMNYYVCPENPDMMKLMAGVEYFNSHGTDSTGDKGYNGWQFLAGVRVNF